MSALETRTVDSKREMDILDKLQEIRGRNARLERADTDEVLERISSRRDPVLMDEEERAAEVQRLQEEEEDEELVKRYFARGVVPQPPSIELEGEDAEGATGDVEGLGDDTFNGAEDEPYPVAGPSGTSSSTNIIPETNENGNDSPASASASGSSKQATAPAVKQTVVKRKIADVEPDAVSLLSDEARKIVEAAKFKAPPLPPKKKKNTGSSLLGIKLKGK
jgi:hypothetical protein